MSGMNPGEQLDLIDEICESFESVWQSGREPDLVEFAARYPGDLNQVLEYLLPIDREYRDRLTSPSKALFRDTVVAASTDTTAERAPGTDKLPVQIGQYRILRKLGQGGMGVVYEAVHLLLKRRVAVKVLLSHGDLQKEGQARFERESRAAAALHHTNIIPVFEVGQTEDIRFYAMQLIEGTNLLDWSKSRAVPELIEVKTVAELGRQVADGLGYAHSKGIVHRDIKPANLILDESGNVWIADFGLAKFDDDELTKTGNVVGTLRYLAPERLSGVCTERSDIYALGATLYELLTQKRLYEVSEHSEMIKKILEEEPVPIQKWNPKVSYDLATIVHKALAKDPESRFESAAELSKELERFLSDEPIRSRRVSAIEKLIRYARNNKAMAAAILGIVILLFSLVGVLAWAFNNALQFSDEQAQLVASNRRDLYFAEMNLASPMSESATGNSQLSDRIASWEDFGTAEDLRGWEWYFFDSLCHQERQVVQHGEGVIPFVSTDVSPDGSTIAIGTAVALFLFGKDGQMKSECFEQLANSFVNDVAWDEEAKRLASSCSNGKLCLWDPSNGSLLASAEHGQGGRGGCLEYGATWRWKSLFSRR